MANKAPGENHLQFVSFVIHATRGVIREQSVRRKTMFALLGFALLLLVSGSTFLAPVLNPREHLGTALVFWIACVWLTLTALLLALFDLVAVRRSGRRAELNLQQRYSDGALRPGAPADERQNSTNERS